jgi:hypothetical protein|tara:strand:- start:95 stop:472 length:378 start_codon:yes stop_codon:yes gene_type:complete
MACVNFVNLCHIAGTTINVDWSYTEDDGVTPIDITGVTAQLQYLTDPSDIASVVDLSGGVVDGVNGLGRHSLTIGQSQSLLPIGSAVKANFISQLMFTYPDFTKEVVAGINSTYEQNLIRPGISP